MKAVRLHGHGETDELHYEETDEPKLRSPHDAIVEIKAAAVNRLDIRLRRVSSGSAKTAAMPKNVNTLAKSFCA